MKHEIHSRNGGNMNHKYYLSAITNVGYIGMYYCVDFDLDTVDRINKMTNKLKNDGYSNVVILFFKELKE